MLKTPVLPEAKLGFLDSLSSPTGRAKAPAGAGSRPHKSQFFAEPTGRGAQGRQYVMPTFVTNCLQAQPGRGAQGQLYLVPNVRNALAAGLARQIPIYWTKLSTVNCQFENARFFQTIGYAPVIDTIVHRTL